MNKLKQPILKRFFPAFGVSLIIACGLLFVQCKKYEYDEGAQSDFLEVEEKNSSVLFHYSSTTSANSGGAGYTEFSNYLADFDSTDVLLTLTEGNIGGGENDTVFSANAAAFNVLTTSTFYTNFTTGTVAPKLSAHRNGQTIVNANYELDITDTKINIKTTTKFFQETTGETFFLTPYVLVDSIVANQTGHPDGASTNHRKVAVDVGRIINFPVRYLGYEVASGDINAGYQFNRSFVVDRRAEWTDPDQISVALILTKRNSAGNLVFVNAHTNN
ncbi:MAG: hypothetical protein P8P74_10385 [Crocinitomicaceae bacterium]|nr:hypothetical protein [Crocinitomicaceae bacterium]